MELSYLLNGVATGSVASQLLRNGFDPLAMRSYVDDEDPQRAWITRNIGGKPTEVPIMNTNSLLRRDEWVQVDEAVVKAAKPRLKLVGDLIAAGLVYNVPNGLGKMAVSTETQSDMNEATLSMDGLRKSQNDRPVYDLKNTPLIIAHKDFSYSARQLAVSRNSGSPLDIASAELAARRVSEQVEGLAVGTVTGLTFAGGTVQGLTNWTGRQTKTLSNPTASAWTPDKTIKDILAMKLQAQQEYHFGPYMVYASLDWDPYLDDDYKATYNGTTLRERIKQIDQIMDVRTLDYLPVKTIILVQFTSDVIRIIQGMGLTTVQWETQGGMEVNFKVMCIMVPELRADFNGNSGVVHGSYT